MPYPLLAYSKPGSATEFISNLPSLTGEESVGKDFDVRTDAPSYYLYKDRISFYKTQEVKKWFRWNNWMHTLVKHHVAFLIGLNFSTLTSADAGLPHVTDHMPG